MVTLASEVIRVKTMSLGRIYSLYNVKYYLECCSSNLEYEATDHFVFLFVLRSPVAPVVQLVTSKPSDFGT